MGQWDKHTSASDTQQAAAQFFAQYINICMAEFAPQQMKTVSFFTAISCIQCCSCKAQPMGTDPVRATLLSLLALFPVACDSHQVILWRWCRAVLLDSVLSIPLQHKEQVLSLHNPPWLQRTSSGIFPLSFWITFCSGFNVVSFDGEGELKKILPF